MQPLSDTIHDYLIYLRVERGASKSTVKTYGPHLRHFLRWMQENGYSESETGANGRGERKFTRARPSTLRAFTCLPDAKTFSVREDG